MTVRSRFENVVKRKVHDKTSLRQNGPSSRRQSNELSQCFQVDLFGVLLSFEVRLRGQVHKNSVRER